MMASRTVFVVDDDAAVRDAISLLVESVGYKSVPFESCEAFLEAFGPDSAGCLILDARLPGMSGLELLEELNRRKIELPVILITAHGDMPMAVRAMKFGAIDCMPKPFNDDALLACVRQALSQDESLRNDRIQRLEIRERYLKLTSREREVLRHVVAGQTSQEIGDHLGVTRKTIESHRSRLMQKMQANSLAELIRSALQVEGFSFPLTDTDTSKPANTKSLA